MLTGQSIFHHKTASVLEDSTPFRLAAGVLKAEIFFSFHYIVLLLGIYNSVSIAFFMFKVILFRSDFH